MANSLTAKQIMEIIPHRHPFLLVDKIEDFKPGEYAIGYKNVTYGEYYFRGHFPDYPIVPGVLTVEALAQNGAVAILSLDAFKGKTAVFAGIDKCKFRRPVVPGDTVRLETRITTLRGPIGVGEAVATVDGEIACSCTIKFAIIDD